MIVHRGIATTQLDTLEIRRRLEPKCIPQLCLGSLLGTRQSQKSLRKLTRPSFLLKWRIAVTQQERMPCDTSPSPPICYRYCIPFIPGIIRDPLLVGYFPLKPAGINGVFNKLESWSEKRYQPLGYLISLNLSSRCLFQLVLRKQNNKFIKNIYIKEKKKNHTFHLLELYLSLLPFTRIS